MAIINAVILPAKALKSGRHKIRIAVAHNGETRYIVTNIIVDSVREFKNGAIIRRPDANYLNTKLRGLLQRYVEILDELDYVQSFTCAELVFQLKNHNVKKNITLQQAFEEVMDTYDHKPHYRTTLKSLWNAISTGINTSMLVRNLTHSAILNLDRVLKKKRKPSTVNTTMSAFRKVVNYTINNGYVSFKINPFLGYKMPCKSIRQSWLTVEEIKLIKNAEIKKPNIAKCRDLFMLSYYLGGINMVDLLEINFSLCKKKISYSRQKTEHIPKINERVEFVIPEEAWPIINSLIDENGYIKCTRYTKIDRFHAFLSRTLPLLAKEVGLDKIIFYSARKSFAQHAFNCGISTSVIDYILGHSLGSTSGSRGSCLYHYIYVTPDMATQAIRKVLDNLK